MRWKVFYQIGKSTREATIEADSLDHAEEVANRKRPSWTDIVPENVSRFLNRGGNYDLRSL